MTNKFSILVLLTLIWASPILSQTLTVRSGEHDDFTRLVVRIPDGVNWRLEQKGRAAELFVESETVSFDTSEAFSIIPKDRLSSLNQDELGSPLRIQLACECPIKTFTESGNYAVLDIMDPDETPTLDISYPETERYSPEEINRSNSSESPVDARTEAPFRFDFSYSYRTAKDKSQPNNSSLESTDLESDHLRGLQGSEALLSEQIRRAATQGLVNIDQENLPVFGQRLESSGDSLVDSTSTNLEAQTSVDRDMSLVPRGLRVTAGRGQCGDPEMVDIGSWGDDRPFGHQIGGHRTRLVGEFDDVQQDDLVGLAETYLYFAFGAEAGHLLKDLDNSNRRWGVLKRLAELVEHGFLNAPHPFEDQTHCDSISALWSVYADPISPKASVNSGAVIRAFAELPNHLQSHLGPGLLRRFTTLGDTETSELLIRIINRSKPLDMSSIHLAEAELARLNGDLQEADAMVEEVAVSGVKESPHALIELVKRHFELREPLSPSTVEILETYIVETRNGKIGPDIASHYSTALALGGDYSTAFEEMMNLEESIFKSTLNRNLTLLAESADDVTFVELSLPFFSSVFQEISLDLAKSVARRYLSIGFPEQAISVLDSGRFGDPDDEVYLLRAHAALAVGLPRRALLELVGIDDLEAIELRATALRMSGLHADAAELFAEGDMMEESARSAWLAGLPSKQQSTYGELFAVTRRLSEPPEPSSEVSLTGARALLKQAENLRRDVEVLSDERFDIDR